MYRYDQYDLELLEQRTAQFRDQVARRLSGALSEEEFLPLRLQNGLYLQRHAYMLRVAIPYGTLSANQLRVLAEIAERWDRGYGHFTTRQNVQFNWIHLEDAPDIMDRLAEAEMHAIQTSGNVVRNITTEQFAGVAADEVMDPRPLAEILRQWSTMNPEFAFLPRKFKIAISSSATDRAAVKAHDVGLYLYRGEQGEALLKVLVGGGLGRTPMLGTVIREALPWRHLTTYVEAVLRVYNRHGRRDNKYKARIKILVQALGADAFSTEVEREWEQIKDSPATITKAEYLRVAAHFAQPPYADAEGDAAIVAAQRQASPAFARWCRRNVHAHQVAGYACVTLSTKPGMAAPPGDVTSAQMRAVADWAEQYGFGEIRVSHEQNLILPDVRQRDLYALWQEAEAAGLATANIGLLTDVIACPGGDYCSLANARSIPVAQAIQARFQNLDFLHDLGELSLNISGCVNACGHHHLGNIGVLGVDKNGEEWYQVTLGGNQGLEAAIGKVIGRAFRAEEMPDVIDKIVATFCTHRAGDESFSETYTRIGLAPFKERVYAQEGV
ncbi:nitrite/sulfite reductase [Pseudogulbenkiania subflava]|uniref:Sulfite reductase (NADPH) hemoprotein beta-component n=1 Tax=Pseudogulbenkiania subflava DSM 22618 TaxID=1123014 RepID=A0A1Y6BG30_9NEIS|nr:nitrite/sulfite reductase [Pseudogulbenkiania subflava]SMF05991.1 sulfite reductase (NADPH) hemoprotein beta-component [Pseudogulbenkiania subflava DSM 22618]